jgi:hypothetical protein
MIKFGNDKIAIFYGFLNDFGKKCKRRLMGYFYPFSNLYLSLDAQPDIQILNGL